MTHPAIAQLHFARSEFRRGLASLSAEEARRRIGPANSIAWNLGHLAWQEQRYWIVRIGGLAPISPSLDEEFCFGCPPSDPDIEHMWTIWRNVTEASELVLEALTTGDLVRVRKMGSHEYTAGNLLNRTIYHYWFHLGESMGLRQALGHVDLPQFVGNIDDEAPFRPF